jgi:hypothetical protein
MISNNATSAALSKGKAHGAALSNFQEYVTQEALANAHGSGARKLMMSSHSNEVTQEDLQHFDSLQYMTQKITSSGKLGGGGKKTYKPILH